MKVLEIQPLLVELSFASSQKHFQLIHRHLMTGSMTAHMTKVCQVKAMVFPVVMYGSESWTIKKAECWRIDGFWTVVLEEILESLLGYKEIKPVHPKGYQSWIFSGRTDAKAETPMLWPSDVKNRLIVKDPDAGKDRRQEEKGMTEDETVGWHHWLNGHEFEQAPGVSDGQGSLVCCRLWGHEELNMTERLNWTELIYLMYIFIDGASLVAQW